MSLLLTFTECTSVLSLEQMLYKFQTHLSRILCCEGVYIFVKDMKSQLKVITRDRVLKHYDIQHTHIIGQVFEQKVSENHMTH